MEKIYTNYIGKTSFFVDLQNGECGIFINKEDSSKADEIVGKYKDTIESYRNEWFGGVNNG